MEDELGDKAERELLESVASQLGISPDDLADLDWKIEPHTGADGLVDGNNIYFSEGSDSEILAKIKGLDEGRWVRIGHL